MKKITYIILLVFVCSLFTGCFKKESDRYDPERAALEKSIKDRKREEYRKNSTTKFISEDGSLIVYIPNFRYHIIYWPDDPNTPSVCLH